MVNLPRQSPPRPGRGDPSTVPVLPPGACEGQLATVRAELVRRHHRGFSQYVSWRLGEGSSKATANKEIGWLKAALTEAARQDLISWETVARIRDENNPKRLPSLRKANRSRERVLMPREIAVLFAAAVGNRNLHDALTLAFWTGLRQ